MDKDLTPSVEPSYEAVDWEEMLEKSKGTLTPSDNANGFFKYQEDKTLKEVRDYITSTYKSHYTTDKSNIQVIDLIESIGDAEPFSRSSAIKYLSRFGRKNGKSKLDLLKAIHFCILLYHFSGIHENTTDQYRTF